MVERALSAIASIPPEMCGWPGMTSQQSDRYFRPCKNFRI